MAFTVRDFHDLVRILDEHPEWREELRRRVLSDEVLSLPAAVRQLVEAQRQTQAEVRKLAEAQQRTEARLEALTAHVAALAEAMQKMAADVGRLKHWGLEQQYRLHAPAYFGHLLRGLHTLSSEELAGLLDQALDEGRLSREERSDILLADLVIRGQPWEQPKQELYLAVEVSWGIGMEDVERAVHRAKYLERVVRPVFPAIAGMWLSPDAKDMADAMKVLQVTDGVVKTPEGWPRA